MNTLRRATAYTCIFFIVFYEMRNGVFVCIRFVRVKIIMNRHSFYSRDIDKYQIQYSR